MGMGSSDLNIDYSNDSAVSAQLKGKSPQQVQDFLNNKVFGNTTAPPPVATLDVTDSRLAAAASARALQLQTSSLKGSFLTGPSAVGGGDKGLAQRQAALALTNPNKGQ